MAQIQGIRLKNLRNGLTMLEMAYEFDKVLQYVGNEVYMWGNDVDQWEIAKICGN